MVYNKLKLSLLHWEMKKRSSNAFDFLKVCCLFHEKSPFVLFVTTNMRDFQTVKNVYINMASYEFV